MRRHIAASMTAFLLATAAQAQEATEEQEAEAAYSGELEVEQGAILPSSENHENSAAPTMAIDCVNEPAECEEPLEATVEGPALSTPDDPATAGVEAEAGAEVRAEP